jgi:streptogramin lyase
LPTSSAVPNDITVGPDGNLWLPYRFDTHIAKVTPTGTATEYDTGQSLGFPRMVAGSDGNLWMMDGDSFVQKVSTAGAITATYPLTGQGGVGGIALGPDGNIWMTELNSSQVARITPAGTVTEFTEPAAVDAYGITGGPDGNVWYADNFNNSIGKVTPTGGITEYPLPGDPLNQDPDEITKGPDGNLWFTVPAGNRGNPLPPSANIATGLIGKITPAGVATEYVLPAGTEPDSITAGPDGNLWFMDGQNSEIGRITPSGQVGLFATGQQNYGSGIVTGPDGRIWFTLQSAAVAAFSPFVPTPSAPDVSALSPVSSSPSGGIHVQISGYDIGTGTQVLFGSTPASSFTVTGPSQIDAVAPPHAPGVVDITVVTPSGTTATSAASKFYYNAPNCGTVITRSTNLKANIGPCYTGGVVVNADNVTLNLAGHSVIGFPGPSDGNSVGVLLQGRSGVTVKNGTVSGFDAGVVVLNRGSNTIKNLTLKDNIGPDAPLSSTYGDGIFIDNSPGNQVLNNTITHNGIYDGIGVYDPLSNNNVITNNVITNTVGPSNTGPSGQGIIVNGATGTGASTFIQGTQMINNIVQNNASAGIANVNEVKGSIVGNTVTGNGTTNSIGNGIGISVGFNWNLGPTNMLIQNNQVHGNGVDGIRIGNPFGFGTGVSDGNQIIRNNAANNAVNPAADTYEGGIQGYDLDDLNANCGADIWSGNIWGSGGFSPACTTTGGSGPAAAAAKSSLKATAPTGPNAKAWTKFIYGGGRR